VPREDGQFKAGNPGRPKGSRNKITKEFLDALAADFEIHGAVVIEKVRRERPDVYLKLIAQLVPRDWDVRHSGNLNIELVSFKDVTQDDLESRQETFDSDATTAKKLDS